jgi:hypothetical protein
MGGCEMAKPIRKTPTLKGEKAEQFVEEMLKTEKRQINQTEKEIVSIISPC